MITDFRYNDIVLYCKGWYERSENIIEDLGYLFSKVYGWTPKSEEDVARMMLRVLDSIKEKIGSDFENFGTANCYLGFHTEVKNIMRLYKVSFDMACIILVKSILFELTPKHIKLNKPHYGKKEHFRLGSICGNTPISMTYTEMNRIAEKAFG